MRCCKERKKLRSLRSSGGSVLLEFTVVFPVMLMILAGLVDFGLEMKEQSVLVEAARIGARTAAKMTGLPAQNRSELARSTAGSVIASAGMDPSQYRYNVIPFAADGIDFIRFSVSKSQKSKFVIRAADAFPSCALAVFRNEEQVPPATIVGDNGCAQ